MGIKTEIKPRIYILCNGELAEPQYFQSFKDSLKAHNIIIRYKKEFIKKAPWDFIDAAISFKEEEQSKGRFSHDDGDQIWCVFDIDNYWNDNEQSFKNAITLANENGLKIAWSNECFEFWFLCHFNLYNSAIPRNDYHKKLKKHFKDEKLGTYTKNMKGVFELITSRQPTAIKNAKSLYKANKVQNNPSTSVFQLIEVVTKYFD